LFEKVDAEEFSERHLAAVHDADFVQFIRKSCEETPEGKSIYPYVFPIRNKTRPPRERSVLSGYYCIDTFTPINRNAYTAARRATDCALTAARQIIGGRRIAYALVRPPGHHAERRAFGGFCYFNNNAVAAHYLSQYGRVAILDIDYHHGNGQQDIFYRRQDVLTVSIHGAPSFAYPYFSGFREETGEDSGKGFNLNLPLPESVNGKIYRKYLARALHRIEEFNPSFLVLALGFDTSKGDPTGTWNLTPEDFERNGRMIGELGLPTVVTQEGGYRTRSLGIQAKKFFQGLTVASLFAASDLKPDRVRGIRLRHDVLAQDPEKIAQLVAATGFFTPTEIGVAVELVREYLSKGAESGYQFLFAEHSNRLAGYSCYGQAPMTVSSWDLYWIAVHPEFQAKKLGRSLLKETENKIRKQGGKRLFVETSMKPQYHSTRVFYEHNGFKLESLLEDYYAPGDAKAIYSKTL
jgi:acetoin utilization deacetylase AcuC-like enzyme/N-acetylglutamate synthase-like GNAT family acetyltransferase